MLRRLDTFGARVSPTACAAVFTTLSLFLILRARRRRGSTPAPSESFVAKRAPLLSEIRQAGRSVVAKHRWLSVHESIVLERPVLRQTAPLFVAPFTKIRELGHLPRRTNCGATRRRDGLRCGEDHTDMLVEVTPEWSLERHPIVMISHIWTEPSGDGGNGRPDNAANRKHEIVCRGISALCETHGHDEESVYVFLEWVSIPQDATWDALACYLESLPAFIAQMSYVLVPLDMRLLCEDQYRLDEDGNPLPMSWAECTALAGRRRPTTPLLLSGCALQPRCLLLPAPPAPLRPAPPRSAPLPPPRPPFASARPPIPLPWAFRPP